MFFKNKICLSITLQGMKVVIGRFNGKKLFIKHMFELPLPKATRGNKREENYPIMQAMFYKALKGLKINYNQYDVICTTDNQSMITRHLTLPYVDDTDAQSMILYEIENYLSINVENYELRHMIQRKFTAEDGSEKMRVFVCALPKADVAVGYNFLKNFGLNPIGLDFECNAIQKFYMMAKNINLNKKTPKYHTSAFIDIGYEHMMITIISDNQVSLYRYIPISIPNLDILDQLTPSETPPDAFMQEALSVWILNIQRIFRYYTSRDVGEAIDCIYLYGGNAPISAYQAELSEALHIPVELLRMIDNISFSSKIKDYNITKYVSVLGALTQKVGVKNV